MVSSAHGAPLFCERYDGPAFDPKGEILPLEFFEPMVRRVFAASRQTIYAAFAVAEIVLESGNARNGVV